MKSSYIISNLEMERLSAITSENERRNGQCPMVVMVFALAVID